METAFCIHCGQNMNAPVAPPSQPAASTFCTNCGRHNLAGIAFCGSCGNPLTAPQAAPYGTNYGQAVQYPQQQQPQYGQPQYSQPQPQYNQGGYQQYSQQPMTLRCSVCMAMSPIGTPNCPSCHTSLAGIVPTPVNMPPQGQQGMFGGGGGMGNFLQGSNGQMAMGALGGAAAVIGGQMLLHGVENSIENRIEGDMGYDGYEHHRRHHREEGLLGGLGDIAGDVGLF